MFVYVIVRLILKRNGFFDYITSKKLSHRTQPEDAGCAEMQITQTDFFCWCIWRLETYEGQPASKWVLRDPRDFILITLHIRFQNRRRTNGPSRHSETSLAEGKVSKLHLPVFVTDANSSLPLRLPAAQPPPPEVRGGIWRRTLTRSAARRPAEERA